MQTRAKHFQLPLPPGNGPRRRIAAGLALAAFAGLSMAAAWADGDHGEKSGRPRDDHIITSQDRAIRLRESGKILPLVDVIRLSGLENAGQVIKVELEMEDGQPVYEIKIMSENGRVREYHIDPSNGRILEVD